MYKCSNVIKKRNNEIRKDFNMHLVKTGNVSDAYFLCGVDWDLSERTIQRIVNGR